MRVAVAIALLVGFGGKHANADPDPTRCGRGADFLHRGDLPRAALYLDGCDDDASAPARRELRKRLDASQLAVVEIVTKPAGLEAETNALPGEQFTTPATLWVPAGTYVVHAGALTGSVTTKPHARSVVILEGGTANATPTAPRNGTADFSDEAAAEPAETGPPPAVQHGTLLPCKFAGTCAASGDQLDDPFATRASAPPAYPRVQLELRGGAIETNTSGLAPAIALGTNFRAPWQDATATHPWSIEGRYAWDRRGGKDEWTAAEGIAKVIAATDDAWLSLGAQLGYSSYDGAMACALARVAIRRLPVAIATSYEQSLTRTDDRALVVELAAALRL